MLNAA
jgi:IS5 family transposase